MKTVEEMGYDERVIKWLSSLAAEFDDDDWRHAAAMEGISALRSARRSALMEAAELLKRRGLFGEAYTPGSTVFARNVADDILALADAGMVLSPDESAIPALSFNSPQQKG